MPFRLHNASNKPNNKNGWINSLLTQSRVPVLVHHENKTAKTGEKDVHFGYFRDSFCLDGTRARQIGGRF